MKSKITPPYSHQPSVHRDIGGRYDARDISFFLILDFYRAVQQNNMYDQRFYKSNSSQIFETIYFLNGPVLANQEL